MDPFRAAIRCIVTFVFLFVMLRMSGKRVVSQTTAFDFVLSLIVGDLVDDFLFSEVTASEFVIATATLVLADLIIKYIGYRNKEFDFLVNGRPTVILRHGKADQSGSRKECMHRNDLLGLLRIKGFDEETLDEIETAILEDSGEVSVIEKQENKTVQKKEKDRLKARTK